MSKGKLLSTFAILAVAISLMFVGAESRSRIVLEQTYVTEFADLTADSTWELAHTINLRNLRSYPLQISLRARQTSAAGGNLTSIAFVPSFTSDASDWGNLGAAAVPTNGVFVLMTVGAPNAPVFWIPWTSSANKDTKYHLVTWHTAGDVNDLEARQWGYSNLGAFHYLHIVIQTDRTAGTWTIDMVGIGDL